MNSSENFEAKTIAVDALMALHGPNETTLEEPDDGVNLSVNKSTVITVHVRVQGQRNVKSVNAIIMVGGDGGRYGGDNYAGNADVRDRNVVLGRSLQYNNDDHGRNRHRHRVDNDDNRDQGRKDGAYDRHRRHTLTQTDTSLSINLG